MPAMSRRYSLSGLAAVALALAAHAAAAADLQTILDDAARGDRRAQFTLGAMYETGRGVARDDALCARWWRASAEQGLADAEKNMGSLYFSGRGVPMDKAQSMAWFAKAAEQDHPHAQRYLAYGYEEGVGVEKDPGKAQYWKARAAKHDPANAAVVFLAAYEGGGAGVQSDEEIFALFQQQALAGNPRAQFYIGVAYASGMGVERDPAKSVEWVAKAAALGVKSAQGNLGLAYLLGDGVARDPVTAQQWFLIAAAAGSDVGGYLSERNGADLTAEERARAQALADAWLAKNPQATSSL